VDRRSTSKEAQKKQGGTSKGSRQECASKDVQARMCKQKVCMAEDTSKEVQVRGCAQGNASKGVRARKCKQGSASKGVQARKCKYEDASNRVRATGVCKGVCKGVQARGCVQEGECKQGI
jgi:hypothetical protein